MREGSRTRTWCILLGPREEEQRKWRAATGLGGGSAGLQPLWAGVQWVLRIRLLDAPTSPPGHMGRCLAWQGTVARVGTWGPALWSKGLRRPCCPGV